MREYLSFTAFARPIPLLVAKLSIDSSDIISRKEIPLDGGPNISDQFYSYVAGIIFYNCCELFNFFFISFDAPSEYHCSSRIFVLFPVIVANSVSSISFPDIVIIFVYREIVDGVNETLSIVDQFRPVFENIYRNIIEIYYSHFFLNYWKLLLLKNSRIKSKFREWINQIRTFLQYVPSFIFKFLPYRKIESNCNFLIFHFWFPLTRRFRINSR